MFKSKEFNELPLNERLVIIYYIAYDYPQKTTANIIASKTGLHIDFCRKAIKKYNTLYRLKLEERRFYKTLKELILPNLFA
jgi:hypothetical protein